MCICAVSIQSVSNSYNEGVMRPILSEAELSWADVCKSLDVPLRALRFDRVNLRKDSTMTKGRAYVLHSLLSDTRHEETLF